MRILIIGACGFVGSTLACGIREGWPEWEIVGLDNLVRAGSELKRAFLRQRGIKVIHGDIRLRSDLEEILPCDWIIDAAANPSVVAGVDGKTSSRQLLEHNLVGTLNLLELARQWSCGFLMLSTSRVYSIPQLAAIPVKPTGERFVPAPEAEIAGLGPQGISESFSTEPPLSLYGASKRASELLVCEYGETFQFPFFINRCGVLAGAGQYGKAEQGIFSYWIHAWGERRPLAYLGFGGKGYQVRDCLHPRDLLALMVKQLKDPAANVPRTINVSGGLSQSSSLRELSQWCEKRFGFQPPLEAKLEERRFDLPWLVLDSTQARTAWQWMPEISLKMIWSELADYAESHPDWLATVLD